MDALNGTTLGPYQIIEPLGEGGMATVYKAFHPTMERYVAVKVLPRRYAKDPEFIARFRHEAKVLASLQHPHILPVFDFGVTNDYSYLVMPMFKGGTLTDFIKQHTPTLSDTRRIISQIGSALQYAHERGVIHRDVKPSNILLDESNHALLSDFGLAKIMQDSVAITAAGTILGTPAYMSPEQSQGNTVDQRSDLYSLGIILYELATGQAPYRADTPFAVMMMHIHDPLPVPHVVNPAVSPALEAVLLKALAKNPAQRYQTAQALVDALNSAIPETTSDMRAVAIEPDVAPPESALAANEPSAPPPPPAYRFPRWMWAVLAVGLVLVAVWIIVANQPRVVANGGATQAPPQQPTGAPIATFAQPNVEQSPVVAGTPLPTPDRDVVLFVNDFFDDVQVFAAQPFAQNTISDNWVFYQPTKYTITDGTIKLEGVPDWNSAIISNSTISNGQGYAFQMRYSGKKSFAFCDLGLSQDQFQEYNKYAIYHMLCNGPTTAFHHLQGDYDVLNQQPSTFDMKPDVWYDVVFAILPAGDFVAVVRQHDDPTQSVTARGFFDVKWSGFLFAKTSPEASLELRDVLAFSFAQMK